MRLRRLRSMGAREIAHRSRLEILKWWDRMSWSIRKRPRSPERPVETQGLFESFRESAPERFFEGPVHEWTPGLAAECFPEARLETITAAEAACEGRFDLLGYQGLSFGHPVDWQLDPVSGRRAPLVHWTTIDALDPLAVGDSKVIWELNRHQWLVDMGRAYRLTGDERYARSFAAYVQDWIRSNPGGLGINWASSLEVAMRIIAWCWALLLFRRSPALTPDLFAEMRGSIGEHANHVARYLSCYFSPNTHLTGEALGLFYAGIVFPDVAGARRWLSLGSQILVEQIESQVHRDGVYFEQSTCYQRYTLEIYLHFLLLLRRVRLKAPAAVLTRLQTMLDFLLAVRRPDGRVPSIGDADGGWLLPLARRAPEDMRGVFSTAAIVLDRRDCAWAAGGLAPETLWLLGPVAVGAFHVLRPSPPAGTPSRLFSQGGYAVLRDGWGERSHHMVFDVGPLGCPVSGGHGHADLLSIQCSAFGEAFLVDAGTGSYTPPRWRNHFRGTGAHSTVLVDGQSQAAPIGPFAWKDWPSARLRRWTSDEVADYADGEHDAYAHLPDPVRHRRRVLFVKPRYWIVLDELLGAAEHAVEARFQFAPVEVGLERDLWARARGPLGFGLLLRSFSAAPLTAALQKGERDPVVGWVSPDYGQNRPAPVLIYGAHARLPLRILTLLLPLRDPSAAPPRVRLLGQDGTGPWGIAFEEGEESVWFGPEGVALHLSHGIEAPCPKEQCVAW